MSSILKLEMNCNEMVEEYNILQSQCHWRLWVRLHNVWQTMVRFRPYFFTAKQHWLPIFQPHNGLGGWFWIAWEESPLKRKQPAANSEIERAMDASGQCGGVVCILLGDADWQWRRSGDSGDGEGDGPTCPGQLCSVRPPGRSRTQPLYQHRTPVVPHLFLLKPCSR